MAKAKTHEKYQEIFQKQLIENDPLQHVLLKGHLIIESALDNILTIIFFHPEYVLKTSFSFFQKVQLARAYALRKDKDSIWQLLLSINEVRNEVAHNLAGERRDKKLKQLRRLFINEMTKEMQASIEKDWGKLEALPDVGVVSMSCGMCTGFLGAFESDITSLRQYIDVLDGGLNPDEERVARKTPEEARKKN